jgi:hypothetical protein
MADLFDTRQIPDDDPHWDALAERVSANAAQQSVLESRARSGATGAGWLIRSRAGWIAASLMLAAALTWMALPTPAASPASLGPAWAEALAPADDVGRAIAIQDAPPSIGMLLLGPPPGGGR